CAALVLCAAPPLEVYSLSLHDALPILGAVGSLKVSASFVAPGLGDFLGAVVFPVGIIAIIAMQAELYTSNCMIMTSVYAGKSKIDRKSTRLNSSHVKISYAVFCLKKKT